MVVLHTHTHTHTRTQTDRHMHTLPTDAFTVSNECIILCDTVPCVNSGWQKCIVMYTVAIPSYMCVCVCGCGFGSNVSVLYLFTVSIAIQLEHPSSYVTIRCLNAIGACSKGNVI